MSSTASGSPPPPDVSAATGGTGGSGAQVVAGIVHPTSSSTSGGALVGADVTAPHEPNRLLKDDPFTPCSKKKKARFNQSMPDLHENTNGSQFFHGGDAQKENRAPKRLFGLAVSTGNLQKTPVTGTTMVKSVREKQQKAKLAAVKKEKAVQTDPMEFIESDFTNSGANPLPDITFKSTPKVLPNLDRLMFNLREAFLRRSRLFKHPNRWAAGLLNVTSTRLENALC